MYWMTMCLTLGLPLGGSSLTAVAGGAGALCCVTNMGTFVTIFLSVAIYNFVLCFVNGPLRVLTPYQSFLEVL